MSKCAVVAKSVFWLARLDKKIVMPRDEFISAAVVL